MTYSSCLLLTLGRIWVLPFRNLSVQGFLEQKKVASVGLVTDVKL